MPSFKFLVYDQVAPEEFGVDLTIEVPVLLTRNAEKDHVVNDQMTNHYETVKAIYIDSWKQKGLNLNPSDTAIKIDFVSSTTKWKNCDYFSHWYDQWLMARYRLVRTRNGRKFYEVECLEKEYDVADGMWEFYEGRIGNGGGDYIEE